jgi:hypothetical protein
MEFSSNHEVRRLDRQPVNSLTTVLPSAIGLQSLGDWQASDLGIKMVVDSLHNVGIRLIEFSYTHSF